MFHLIKLEWCKQKMTGFCIAFLAIFFSGLLLVILGGTVVDEGDTMFYSAQDILYFGGIIFRMSFGICAGVMIATFIMEEYQHKTMQLLFTYPVPRKKWIICKLMIIFIWTFISILLADLLFGISVWGLNHYVQIVEEYSIVDLWKTVPHFVLESFLTAGLGLIPIYFGMRKKSGVTVIVTATLVHLFLNSSFGGSSQDTLFSFIAVPILLCFAGVLVACYTCQKLGTEDV